MILKYLSKGLKVGEISTKMKEDESLVISKSSIEKRLTIIKKLSGAKTPLHMAVIANIKKWI